MINHPLPSLAKLAVEAFVREGKIIESPKDLSKEFLERRSGTFVTIMKNERLRGCVGTYLFTQESIIEEIIQNAIAAASKDYRFGPIRKEELTLLEYIVYILSKPELVRSISELDPKKYGIIVKTLPIVSTNKSDVVLNTHIPAKTGLLLPGLEGIDTAENQIATACQKGEINPEKERIVIYRFTTEKYQ